MSDKNSVHLQDFPKLDNFESDTLLFDSMDKVRAICSLALFIRDKNNLRVRLPLNKITVITHDTDIKQFSSIILDEINVKHIEFVENIEDFANKKVVLNFAKIGSKVGSKMPILMKAIKNLDYKINAEGQLEIDDIKLEKDEFSIVWEAKQENIFAVEGYDILIQLDLTLTKELECEGLARDMVRMIQQYRKDANLNINDRIELFVNTKYEFLKEAINLNKDYIREQTLAVELKLVDNELNSTFSFGDEINNNSVKVGFNVIK
mgnify:CR=1 FL=1